MVGIETREGLFEAAMRVMNFGLACVTMREKHNLWHERLRHCGDDLVRASIPHIQGIRTEELTETIRCESCAKEKATQMPMRTLRVEDREAANPLERVFSDVVGPMQHKSIAKLRYFVTLLDSFSHFPLVRFVAFKSKVADTVVSMVQKFGYRLYSRMQKMTCLNQNSVNRICTNE